MIFALLQQVSVVDGGTGGPVDLLTDPEVAEAFSKLVQADGAGSLATLGAALYFVNLVIRKGGLKYLPAGRVTDFLKTRWGGWLLNAALALGGGGLALARTGAPISFASVWSMVLKSITVAAVAVMANELHKDVVEAQSAGAEAAKDPGPTVNS